MAIEPLTIVCIRVNDSREVVAGATRQQCSRCLAEVWLSPSSAQSLVPGDTLLCNWCIAAAGIPLKIHVLPGQLDEIARHQASRN
jgi:hypothetical protein